jgi:hypothetical protein
VATLQSGFSSSLYFGVPLFPYEVAPVPIPVPVPASYGSSRPYAQVKFEPKHQVDTYEIATPKLTKKYPTIILSPYTGQEIKTPKPSDYVVKQKLKSNKIQDILNDDEELLMLL